MNSMNRDITSSGVGRFIGWAEERHQYLQALGQQVSAHLPSSTSRTIFKTRMDLNSPAHKTLATILFT